MEDLDIVSVVGDVVMFVCPACAEHVEQTGIGTAVHSIDKARWSWDGDLERPTIKPSILVNQRGGRYHRPDTPICHSYVTAGRIWYLPDSTHSMAGETVDLPLWSTRYPDEEE